MRFFPRARTCSHGAAEGGYGCPLLRHRETINQSKDTAVVHVQDCKDRSIGLSKVAYQLPQPTGMISDAFVTAGLNLDSNEREWVPSRRTSTSGRSS
jgi:hypothetical protein